MNPARAPALFAALLLASCASTPLPHGAHVVGGGLWIQWTAPSRGTALLVETSSRKILFTVSLDEGEKFEFDAASDDNRAMLNSLLSTNAPSEELHAMPPRARFVLYFVPQPPPRD